MNEEAMTRVGSQRQKKNHLYGWLGDLERMSDYSAKLTFLFSIKHFRPHFTVPYTSYN
jgi:hypothetical protein